MFSSHKSKGNPSRGPTRRNKRVVSQEDAALVSIAYHEVRGLRFDIRHVVAKATRAESDAHYRVIASLLQKQYIELMPIGPDLAKEEFKNIVAELKRGLAALPSAKKHTDRFGTGREKILAMKKFFGKVEAIGLNLVGGKLTESGWDRVNEILSMIFGVPANTNMTKKIFAHTPLGTLIDSIYREIYKEEVEALIKPSPAKPITTPPIIGTGQLLRRILGAVFSVSDFPWGGTVILSAQLMQQAATYAKITEDTDAWDAYRMASQKYFNLTIAKGRIAEGFYITNQLGIAKISFRRYEENDFAKATGEFWTMERTLVERVINGLKDRGLVLVSRQPYGYILKQNVHLETPTEIYREIANSVKSVVVGEPSGTMAYKILLSIILALKTSILYTLPLKSEIEDVKTLLSNYQHLKSVQVLEIAGHSVAKRVVEIFTKGIGSYKSILDVLKRSHAIHEEEVRPKEYILVPYDVFRRVADVVMDEKIRKKLLMLLHSLRGLDIAVNPNVVLKQLEMVYGNKDAARQALKTLLDNGIFITTVDGKLVPAISIDFAYVSLLKSPNPLHRDLARIIWASIPRPADERWSSIRDKAVEIIKGLADKGKYSVTLNAMEALLLQPFLHTLGKVGVYVSEPKPNSNQVQQVQVELEVPKYVPVYGVLKALSEILGMSRESVTVDAKTIKEIISNIGELLPSIHPKYQKRVVELEKEDVETA